LKKRDVVFKKKQEIISDFCVKIKKKARLRILITQRVLQNFILTLSRNFIRNREITRRSFAMIIMAIKFKVMFKLRFQKKFGQILAVRNSRRIQRNISISYMVMQQPVENRAKEILRGFLENELIIKQFKNGYKNLIVNIVFIQE
jgi:hypothetical protein